VPNVQWKTPDDGQRNCPKHVEFLEKIPYFPAHKMCCDFFIRNFRKNNECILILVIYWKKTGLLHTKISNRNIIYSSEKPRKSSSLPLKSSSWLFSLSHHEDVV